MNRINKIDVRLWPLRLSVEGQQAIDAVKWPLTAVLTAIALAIVSVLTRG